MTIRVLPVILASLLASLGSFWAFSRGGQDFHVFHRAWELVLAGQGAEIYRATPDRFLYAPGFAWLLSPLGVLPFGWALGVWCLLKAAALGGLVRRLTQHTTPLAASLALLLIARPLLIDFQYGQVNFFIVAICAWALLRHFESTGKTFWHWGGLAIAALSKLFPLPLLGIPVLAPHLSWGERRRASLWIAAGLTLVFVLPFLTEGWIGGWELLRGWRVALSAKGLPLESHNQSVAAFFHRFLGSEPTHIVLLWKKLDLGWGLWSAETLRWFTILWTILGVMAMVFWIRQLDRVAPLPWLSVLIAFLIVPLHLVWKPYFVMGYPLIAWVLYESAKTQPRWTYGLFGVAFCLGNLTGFDFIGHYPAAYLEAACLQLWLHLFWLVLALIFLSRSRQLFPRRARGSS